MKIIFNDILSSTSSPVEPTGEIKFISSGLIFEKKLVLAQLFTTVQDLIDAYLNLSSEDDRRKLYESPEAEAILNDPKNRKEFHEKVNWFKKNPKSNKKSGDPIANAAQFGLDEAEFAGVPASKFAPFMEKKDQIIQRLRPFMSEQKIGEVFNDLLEDVKLDYTETIGILDECISQARSCNTQVEKVINFFVAHYKQKRQYSLTKELIKDACELQKLNPVVDIFGVMIDAISGNQPEVGLMYAMKDPDAMKAFNYLISLSQSNAPEQSEEVRIKMQEGRDALKNAQDKFNMKKALVDMMKIEETNKQLVSQIKTLGTAFEFLLTQPMYRALRDMLYDLRAGKIILNQASSIFTGDRSPSNKRSTIQEQSILRDNSFPSINEEKQPFASKNLKFVKLASPEVTRHIFAQTAPNLDERVITSVADGFNRLMKTIIDQKNRIVSALKNVPILKDIINFFDSLFNAFNSLMNQLKNRTFTNASIEKAFEPFTKGILSDMAGSEQPAQQNAQNPAQQNAQNFLLNTIKPFKRSAQRNPMQGNTAVDLTSLNDIISNGSAVIVAIASTVLGFFAIQQGTISKMRSKSWTEIFNGIAPLLLILKNIAMEIYFQLFPSNRAPVNSKFFDPEGKLTIEGKQTLVNAKETMISLGIADQDAMALSKFKVEKEYLLQFLNKKEQNLEDYENQSVQTGSGTTETTVGTSPEDYEKKVNEFLAFCYKLDALFKQNLNIFRNGITNAKKQYDSIQSTHIEGELEEYKADVLTIQKKIAEWDDKKKTAARMFRKRILLQRLKPLQLQMETMKKLGIPMSNIIASPNGILAMSGAIRREVYDSLVELRKQHEELSNLIQNPDKISQFVKYPTDTGVTKLPEYPDQSDSDKSPFEAPEGSQFRTEENANSGAKNV